MNILISNDDGIESNGLITLVNELSKIANVYVVAPNCQKSATSHALTIMGKLKVEERQLENAVKAYAVWGTPADSVHLAMHGLFDIEFDVVVSGINQGGNFGSDVIYSGTCGAAREALIYGTPAIAISLDSFTSTDFSFAARVAKEVVLKYVKFENNTQYVLNVNVPSIPVNECKGYRFCRKFGVVAYDEGYHPIEDETGKYYQMGLTQIDKQFDPNDMDYDTNACKDGYIALNTININFIKEENMDHLIQNW